MLAIIGDIHGNFGILARLVAQLDPNFTVMQVGDFGFWPYTRQQYVVPDRLIRFVDGNHDHIPGLMAGACDWPNAEYMPRGTVQRVAGKRILFLGGAKSPDRSWRPAQQGRHAWFTQEIISQSEIELALTNAAGGVDLMITHSPPDWLIRKHFSPMGLLNFGIDPREWKDQSAEAVEYVWRELGQPPLYCGHMHRSVVDGNCRILDINEVCCIV